MDKTNRDFQTIEYAKNVTFAEWLERHRVNLKAESDGDLGFVDVFFIKEYRILITMKNGNLMLRLPGVNLLDQNTKSRVIRHSLRKKSEPPCTIVDEGYTESDFNSDDEDQSNQQ